MPSLRICIIVLGLGSSLCLAADGPPDAAVQNVFTSTIEQASGPVQVKLGQTCDKPKVRGFRLLKRGAMEKTPQIPQGFYPMTAQVELQCGTADQVQRWNGQLELQVYQNSVNAWSVRW
ncbi:MAG TPA: hypothetical protein VFC24_10110 [Casimicrobiaceae bacterium]|nr:hypothetical protein [Casimicrobiaceae bacterium]